MMGSFKALPSILSDLTYSFVFAPGAMMCSGLLVEGKLIVTASKNGLYHDETSLATITLE
jgi:hypothetical protein